MNMVSKTRLGLVGASLLSLCLGISGKQYLRFRDYEEVAGQYTTQVRKTYQLEDKIKEIVSSVSRETVSRPAEAERFLEMIRKEPDVYKRYLDLSDEYDLLMKQPEVQEARKGIKTRELNFVLYSLLICFGLMGSWAGIFYNKLIKMKGSD